MQPQDENQDIQALQAVEHFVKIFVKNYPLVIRDGKYCVTVLPDAAQAFPYEVIFEITKKQ